jgi:hexosaminidase
MNKIVLFIVVLQSVLLGMAQCPIVPHPTVYKETGGSLMLGDPISIQSEGCPSTIQTILVDRLNKQFKLNSSLSTGKSVVQFKQLYNVPKDFYSILIEDKITISYSSEASCFYAVNSLLQLIQVDQQNAFVQKCFIQDQPRFEWRGLHLDVSRHFFTVDEVKKYIDLMSYYKFNTFHWHLTDDQGWRIEIKKFPKLTEIGAFRDSTVNNHYSTTPRTYTVEKYGGYYTQEEIREVVKYASDRYINVVPEIEMPGHSRAAIAAYPELSCTGEQLGVPGLWGVFDDIFCTHESNFDFIKQVLDEVIVLFPSEYIHIGGDEAPKNRWKKCKKCQANIRENGLKDEHELQSFFIRKIDAYLTSKGRKLIGWDEILEGGLSPNAAVMSWRGFEGGVEAAKQHHYAVMSPGSHCYFDHYQSTNPTEPLAIGGFTSLEKVYNFEPIPPSLSVQDQHYILGGQANVWTEYIPTFKQVEYMTYPRALALAQVLWSNNKPTYDQFEKSVVDFQIKFLERLDVNFSRALAYPQLKRSKTPKGIKIKIDNTQGKSRNSLERKIDGRQFSAKQDFSLSDSIELSRTANEIHHHQLIVSNDQLSRPMEFNVVQHPSIGVDISYVTPPSEQYNEGKELTLVDGVIGGLPWKGNEWVGFREKDITIMVSLPEKKSIRGIELNFLSDLGSWIHQPQSMEISLSKNGKKWKSMPTYSWNDPTLSKGELLQKRLIVNKKAIQLKLTIHAKKAIEEGSPGEGNIPWTFMDELVIF